MDIKVFAPVLIPTLNRYTHFKNCVESLANCTHADRTELIIGLDYPPSEKYIEGWEKICEYVPKISGFKDVTVIKHDHNLGAADNILYLKKYARQYYDRFIFTEDDNEFSPNFLDYIDKGLESYKDNPRVFGICGYNYIKLNMEGYDEDYYFSHEMSAWGYGGWFSEKCDELWKEIRKPDFLIRIIKDVPFFTFLKDNTKLCYAIGNLGYDLRGDAYITYYQRLNDIYCIFPTLSLVRNHGHDGSGLHSGKLGDKSPYATQSIDTRMVFDNSFALQVQEDSRIIRQLNHFPGVRQYIKNLFRLVLIKLFVKI